MATTQTTPVFDYLIRGDTLQLPITVTQKVLVPTWTAVKLIAVDTYIKGTVAPVTYFQCTTAGTTDATEPDWTIAATAGDTLTDGDVTWTNRGELVLIDSGNMAKQPLNIAGWKLSLTVKTSLDEADVDAQMQFDYPIPDSPTARAGQVTALVPASLAASLIPGKAYVDIQLEIPANPEPIIKTFGLGKTPVYGDVTRRVP